MKWTHRAAAGCATAAVLAWLVVPATAQAGGRIAWSVGISSGPSPYYAPAPIYVPPRPVYVQPQPVYVQPQPVYVPPRPVYAQPQPVYVAPPPYFNGPVVAAPVLIEPRAVYPTGWVPRGHRRHRHERGPGWRY